jgi:hypothetical protein
VKIALVALPQPDSVAGGCVAPPLPLGYLAALLEQQRHIVRIYDLALAPEIAPTELLAPLHAFRPQLVVIAADAHAAPADTAQALAAIKARVMWLGTSLRVVSPGQAVAQALWHIDRRTNNRDEQSVIYDALLSLDDDLDSLPFPARHLLPIEQYSLVAANGDLQTTVLLAQQLTADTVILRQPALIAAELHSIAREHGIRHFLFPPPTITYDPAWLHDLLQYLASDDLTIYWEASVRYEALDTNLLQLMRRAGCERLTFEFDVEDVLLSRDKRATLMTLIRQTHELGIGVRAHIELDAPYNAVPALVDISATFGLDDVRFEIVRADQPGIERAIDGPMTLEEITEMARMRYRTSRSRQFFVDRFGPQLGPILWRVGRAGLLGRTWRRYAGGEDGAMAY